MRSEKKSGSRDKAWPLQICDVHNLRLNLYYVKFIEINEPFIFHIDDMNSI